MDPDEFTTVPKLKLYDKLAADIRDQITRGVLRPGERIPSVRQASRHRGVSITTVIKAYTLLESEGAIESHPQSGYYVRRQRALPQVAPPSPLILSSSVDVSRLVLSTLRSIGRHGAMPLGSPYPDPSMFPWRKLNQYANARARNGASWSIADDLPPGHPQLIRQIARRHLETGMPIDPADIIVTVGATEAINLCLQAVAKPGDTIAVESPTFYAMLHAIERLGMRALEVPTDAQAGIDVDALAVILARRKVAACMVMPNFQNPLGFRMPDERKRALVRLLETYDMPAIENDVYRELYFGESHPSTLKSFDDKGLVLYCASFSKSLSAASRIGWTLPGRYRDQVERLKFLNTLTTASLPQVAIAEYLQNDGYDAHLRKIRKAYAQRAAIMRAAVLRFFPKGTEVSTPQGGYVLWIRLPPQVDGMVLYERALKHHITVGPGLMFSAQNAYANYIRLNYSYPWDTRTEAAVRTIGNIAKFLSAGPRRLAP